MLRASMSDRLRRADGSRRLLCLAVAACVAVALVVGGPRPTSALGTPTCLAGSGPEHLGLLFAGEPSGVIGADYQRATRLPDGKVLWTFQDAEVRLPGGGTRLVHNIGMVQDGNCFRALIGGTPDDPRPWLFADYTTPFSHWFWPLASEMGSDGNLYVFAAEMTERGPGYLSRTEPVATAVAVVDVATFDVRTLTRPRDSSAALYGFSIASDSTWTYMFAQCHRQFGFDPYIFVYAHDFSCVNRVTVARVPKGHLLASPAYWTGRGWSSDPATAAPIFDTNRMVNASQIQRVNGTWMAITKVGDWWGDRIVVEQSTRPVGPFSAVAEWIPSPKCSPSECNTYFASWIPSSDPAQLVYGLSHNRWNGVATDVYRPSFGTIAAPPRRLATAERCSLGYCG